MKALATHYLDIHVFQCQVNTIFAICGVFHALI